MAHNLEQCRALMKDAAEKGAKARAAFLIHCDIFHPKMYEMIDTQPTTTRWRVQREGRQLGQILGTPRHEWKDV